MSIDRFLVELARSGRVRASREAPDESAWRRADSVLGDLDRAARGELPGEAPAFSLPAARWGALRLHAACRFLVHRDAGADEVRRALAGRPASSIGPSEAYSADLTLQHLPEVMRLARGIADRDPLVEALRGLGREWPLSSVGVSDLGPVDASGFLEDHCLLRLYADRIVATGDASRIDDPRVLEAVRSGLGDHPELAGGLAGSLAGPVA